MFEPKAYEEEEEEEAWLVGMPWLVVMLTGVTV